MPWPFAGRDGADSRPREAPCGPMSWTVTPSKDESERLGVKRVEERGGRGRRRGRLRQMLCGKSAYQPFWGQGRSLPLVLRTYERWDAHSASTQALGAVPHGHYGIMEINGKVPKEAGWGAHSGCNLCRARSSSKERDTAIRGTCQGARCQLLK